MGRCVIIGGADIKNYGALRSELREDDFAVYCDGGLRHLKKLGKAPDLIIGDFDSHENPHAAAETIVLPCEKDDTDTFFAAKECLKRGFSDFLLIGAAGGRLDHTLGNVAILTMLCEKGKNAVLMDDYSDMRVISGSAEVSGCRYFSLLNITGEASGVTVKNAKYELSDHDITCDFPIGISNELISEKPAVVSLKSGKLLLIRIF